MKKFPQRQFPQGSRAGLVAITFAVSLCMSPAYANGQFNWARAFNGGENTPIALITDQSNNTYVLGKFTGTVDLDPESGTNNHTAGSTSAYIAKINAGGSLVWARSFGIVPTNLALTNSSSLLITGHFQGTVDMDPGAGTANLTATDGVDGCVVELTLAGAFDQAFAINGTATQSAEAAAVDGDGNIVITGAFAGTADFDPSAGTDSISPTGQQDAFVAKYDAGFNLLWARAYHGSGGLDAVATPTHIAVDSQNAVISSGTFNRTYDFDPGGGSVLLEGDDNNDPDTEAYVAKLDAGGDYVWAVRTGCSFDDAAYGLGVDSNDNVVYSGYFRHTVDFDPGPGVDEVSALNKSDIYVLKLNSSGQRIWVKFVMGQGTTEANALHVDAYDEIHLAGFFNESTDFDPGSGNLTLDEAVPGSGDAIHDIFVLKLSSNGALAHASAYGNGNSLAGLAITADTTGATIAAGTLMGTIDFSGGAGTGNLSATSSNTNAFLLKLSGPIATAWVDFAAPSADPTGSQSDPFATFERGAASLLNFGTVKIKGDSSVTKSQEVVIVDKPMTVQAVNGPVVIGTAP